MCVGAFICEGGGGGGWRGVGRGRWGGEGDINRTLKTYGIGLAAFY